MTELSAQQLVNMLRSARWHVAARTFGNNHATLIGIIVDCWVDADSEYSALEGGPSFKPPGTGMAGGGLCDALLCRAGQALGVVEVEGMRKLQTVEKVSQYFDAHYDELKSLEFAVCLFYTTCPTGSGSQKAYRPSVDEGVIQKVIDISKRHSEKLIALVALDKSFESDLTGIRTRSEYYSGCLSRVQVCVYRGGDLQCSETLFPM